jgi:hypothetical protein
MMAEDLSDIIKQNAEGPSKATSDGTSMEQHSLSEQIAADKHLGNKVAGRNPAKAMVRMKIVPSGTV